MIIIGITGTHGAGKGKVVEYLTKEKGFHHYSARQEITEEILRRALPVNRTTMNEVATSLRKQFGADYYSNLFIKRGEAENRDKIIIESIRNVMDAENIKAHGGYLFAVDADKKIRFERIMERKSETDVLSFEEFSAEEDREFFSENPSDPAYMNVGGVMAMADATFLNNTSLEDLNAQIDVALSKISA